MVKPSSFISKLDPYKITAQDVWAASSPSNILKLDWNESPFDFEIYRKQLRKIIDGRGIISWYPDYLALELTSELSRFVNINSNSLLTFPGSDVALETLCRCYLEYEDRVLVISPTYENFFVFVLQTGAQIDNLHVKSPIELTFDLIDEKLNMSGHTKAVYLTRPNNPYGYLLDSSVVKRLALKYPSTMFIVDEAYIEFSNKESCAPLVAELSNIVVSRTFSKAFGLAGLRLGYLCANLDVINNVNKIRNGKNLSMISQKLGLFALRNIDKINDWILSVRKGRELFENWCKTEGVEYYPSHGNFVLFKSNRPAKLCSELKALGIYIRNRDSLVPGYVRLTIGSDKHVGHVINSLRTLHELVF